MSSLHLFLASRFLSTSAYQMQSVAMGWQIYGIRKNPMDLGWVGLVQFVPMILFSLVGGQVADRFERKRILQFVQTLYGGISFLLCFLTYTGRASLPLLMLTLFIHGTIRAFSNPAMQAFLPQVVPIHHLKRAVALNSSVWQVSTILGPVIGGFLYAANGNADLVYFVCGTSLLLAVFCYTFVKAERTQLATEPISWKNLFVGVEYVWKKRIVLGSLSMDLFAVLLGGAVALLPVYASEILHVGPRGLGFLRAAPGAGAILGSLWLAARPIKRHMGIWLFVNVGLFGLATIGFGFSTNFILSLVMLFIIGASDIVSVVIRMTMVQLETPSNMRGRVSAVNSIFISASNELGEFESGVTAAWFGVVPSVVIGGVGSILIALFWAKWFPELRKMQGFSDA